MSVLSLDAQDALRVARELRILDELSLKTLEQLFSVRQQIDLVASLVIGKEDLIATALYKLIANTASSSVRGYILRFTADLTQLCGTISKVFGDEGAAVKFQGEPAAAFLDLAVNNASDLGISSAALHLCASTIRHAAGSLSRFDGTIRRFFTYVEASLSATQLHVHNVEYPIHACAQLARRKAVRSAFLESAVIAQLPRVLTDSCAAESAALIQLSYEALLICWMLSFEYPCIVALHNAKIIPTLHRVLQRVQKEKCVRVALLTLKNFANAQQRYFHLRTGELDMNLAESLQLHSLGAVNGFKGPNFFADMIGVGLSKTLWQLARRKFGDDDIAKEIDELTAVLDQNVEVMTTFTEYKGEIQSGLLEWSPVHTSAKFWKENASKFEENNYEVLSEIRNIILGRSGKPQDLTLAVACHDIGELVRHHPSGRMLLQLQQLDGVKEKIMQLMSHENAEVAKNALLAVQKIMVQRWEFIQ